MYLRTCGGFKSGKSLGSRIPNPESTNPQITKNWSSNRKSSKCHICGSLQILQLTQVCKFAGLRFADRPPLENNYIEENPGTDPIIFLFRKNPGFSYMCIICQW